MQERLSWGGGYKTFICKRGLAGGGGGGYKAFICKRGLAGGEGGGGGYKAFICKSSLNRPDSKFHAL